MLWATNLFSPPFFLDTVTLPLLINPTGYGGLNKMALVALKGQVVLGGDKGLKLKKHKGSEKKH